MCILNLLAGTRDCRPQSFPRWLVTALRKMGAAAIGFFGTVGTVDDASSVPFPETGKATDEAAGLDRYPRLLCFRRYPDTCPAAGRPSSIIGAFRFGGHGSGQSQGKYAPLAENNSAACSGIAT